jgi:hypothetical protein
MVNSKLIEVLKVFSAEDMKLLLDFAAKQTDRKDTLPQKLLLILEKQFPDFPGKAITREKVYNKVFTDKKFNDNKLSKLMSELMKLIEDFIIYSKRLQHAADNKMNLLKFYFEKNLDKYFIATSRELKQLIDDLPYGYLSKLYEISTRRITGYLSDETKLTCR